MTRFLTALALVAALVAQPALATDRKPLVSASGQIKALPAGDKIVVNASATGGASIQLPPGAAPSAPADGDIWTTTAGLYARINGATVGPYLAGSFQPLDSDLTSIAALSTTSTGRDLLTSADAAAIRTKAGAVIGTNVQAYDADLSTYAGITPSANIQTLLGAADFSAARTSLGLAFGTDLPDNYVIYQHADYNLTSTTSVQKIFNETTNGRLTVSAGLYDIKCVCYFTGMSTTSGNASIDIVGGGSAVLSGQLGTLWGRDGAINAVAGAQGGSGFAASNATPTDSVTAGTSAQMYFTLTGIFLVTGAGTMVPSIALQTASGAITKAGSTCWINKLAGASVYTKGPWD